MRSRGVAPRPPPVAAHGQGRFDRRIHRHARAARLRADSRPRSGRGSRAIRCRQLACDRHRRVARGRAGPRVARGLAGGAVRDLGGRAPGLDAAGSRDPAAGGLVGTRPRPHGGRRRGRDDAGPVPLRLGGSRPLLQRLGRPVPQVGPGARGGPRVGRRGRHARGRAGDRSGQPRPAPLPELLPAARHG